MQVRGSEERACRWSRRESERESAARVQPTLAASIGDPPPMAMMTSGLNRSISCSPARTVAIVGSGCTS